MAAQVCNERHAIDSCGKKGRKKTKEKLLDYHLKHVLQNDHFVISNSYIILTGVNFKLTTNKTFTRQLVSGFNCITRQKAKCYFMNIGTYIQKLRARVKHLMMLRVHN